MNVLQKTVCMRIGLHIKLINLCEATKTKSHQHTSSESYGKGRGMVSIHTFYHLTTLAAMSMYSRGDECNKN